MEEAFHKLIKKLMEWIDKVGEIYFLLFLRICLRSYVQQFMLVTHCGIETGNYFLLSHGLFFLNFVFVGSGVVSHVSWWWKNMFQFYLFIFIFLGVEMDFKGCGNDSQS